MFINKTFFTALILIIFFPFYTNAQDNIFCDNEADIIKILTQRYSSQPEIKTRGLSMRGDSRSIEKKRTIVVVTENENHPLPQKVTVQEWENIPKVNMKILFEYNSCALESGAYSLLNELGRALTNKALADRRISLLGHTDSDGSNQYNLNLSLKRARAVKNYLVGNFRLTPMRINIFGYGEAMPLVPNSNSYNKQRNRRVEIRAEKY